MAILTGDNAANNITGTNDDTINLLGCNDVGRGLDGESRTIIQLAVDPMMLDELCVYDAATADLEPDVDLEDEGI